ncbi:MAG: hypothetical protein A2086_09240 [Spirochaetes bacterium GWD1_27_9]|nr:MAG: hypothetical protein A2Z98_05670 [Spirochaetes bacterium GWB1_27_13]OHD28765.1 MAG: hypothetical protein A2086_09240 [Spirochaetes bacterium GWD1_27_9]
MKKFIYLFILILSISCTTNQKQVENWYEKIPDNKKAEFLFNYLNEQYQTALSNGDIGKLNFLLKEFGWVSKLDKERTDEINDLIDTITQSIESIKKNKLANAKRFLDKKDFINASIEYSIVRQVDKSNTETVDFFNKYKNEVNNAIIETENKLKKFLSDKNFIKAEQELRKIILIHSDNVNINEFTEQINKLKLDEFNRIIALAKKQFDEKKYNNAINNAKLALDISPNSKEARDIIDQSISERTKLVKEQKEKEKQNMEAKILIYYNNALTAFQNKQYAQAKKEIKKYLSLNNNTKGQQLEAKINQEIKLLVDNLMGDAILNYNSLKYEEALKMFKAVLAIDTTNEEALDYKARIEKTLQALE